MKRVVRTTSRADVDIGRIWAFIAADRVQKADEVHDLLYAKFEQLARMPESGQRCDGYGDDVRRSTKAGYVIYHKITDIDIEILRVVHGARNLTDLSPE